MVKPVIRRPGSLPARRAVFTHGILGWPAEFAVIMPQRYHCAPQNGIADIAGSHIESLRDRKDSSVQEIGRICRDLVVKGQPCI